MIFKDNGWQQDSKEIIFDVNDVKCGQINF